MTRDHQFTLTVQAVALAMVNHATFDGMGEALEFVATAVSMAAEVPAHVVPEDVGAQAAAFTTWCYGVARDRPAAEEPPQWYAAWCASIGRADTDRPKDPKEDKHLARKSGGLLFSACANHGQALALLCSTAKTEPRGAPQPPRRTSTMTTTSKRATITVEASLLRDGDIVWGLGHVEAVTTCGLTTIVTVDGVANALPSNARLCTMRSDDRQVHGQGRVHWDASRTQALREHSHFIARYGITLQTVVLVRSGKARVHVQALDAMGRYWRTGRGASFTEAIADLAEKLAGATRPPVSVAVAKARLALRAAPTAAPTLSLAA